MTAMNLTQKPLSSNRTEASSSESPTSTIFSSTFLHIVFLSSPFERSSSKTSVDVLVLSTGSSERPLLRNAAPRRSFSSTIRPFPFQPFLFHLSRGRRVPSCLLCHARIENVVVICAIVRHVVHFTTSVVNQPLEPIQILEEKKLSRNEETDPSTARRNPRPSEVGKNPSETRSCTFVPRGRSGKQGVVGTGGLLEHAFDERGG
mmetsp:Transcript_4396/g.28017  ORF Transcript_4396/g.28017 Transcript_4396/m.28017 type:complete len:204 (+) Transcript_4396:2674-3285(+)